MMVKSSLLSATKILWLPEARNGDHRWVRGLRLLAQTTQNLLAVDIWQTDVQKDYIGLELLSNF